MRPESAAISVDLTKTLRGKSMLDTDFQFGIIVSVFFKIAQARGGELGIFLVAVYFFLTSSAVGHSGTLSPLISMS